MESQQYGISPNQKDRCGLRNGHHYQRVSDTIPGDANQDGVVDDQDASILALHWRDTADVSWFTGDFNDDGAVDERDASILASHWGMTNQPTVSMTSVPEPSALVMLLPLAAAAQCARRARRTRRHKQHA
ncbi:MAG: hypothetical protein GX547_00305 [Phycisphaerae bacterium]|nr:hypothetical protein [Phycisphaerae bacterium]